MNVRKFIAATARDALRKVRETLGPDAIILSNRGIPGGVEIMAVAARDMELIVPPPPRDSLRPNGSIDAAAAVAADRSSAGDQAAARPPAVTASFRAAMEGKGLVTPPTEAEPIPMEPSVVSTPALPVPPETTNSPMPLANPVAAPSPVGLEVSSTTDVGSSLLEDDSRYGWEGGHPVDVLPLAGNQQDVREVVIDGSGRWLAQLDTLRARNYELAAKLADYVPNGRASLARIGVGYGFLVLDVFNRDYLEKLFIKANGDNTEERLDAHKTLIHTATLWWLLVSISGTLHDDSLSLALAGRPHPDSQPGWSCPPDLLVSLAPPESLLFIQEENGMSAAAQYHNIYLPEHLLYHWWLRLPDTRLEWVFELIRNVRSIHELISRHAGKTGNASAWEVKTNDI